MTDIVHCACCGAGTLDRTGRGLCPNCDGHIGAVTDGLEADLAAARARADRAEGEVGRLREALGTERQHLADLATVLLNQSETATAGDATEYLYSGTLLGHACAVNVSINRIDAALAAPPAGRGEGADAIGDFIAHCLTDWSWDWCPACSTILGPDTDCPDWHALLRAQGLAGEGVFGTTPPPTPEEAHP